jgi:hypothetical protein
LGRRCEFVVRCLLTVELALADGRDGMPAEAKVYLESDTGLAADGVSEMVPSLLSTLALEGIIRELVAAARPMGTTGSRSNVVLIEDYCGGGRLAHGIQS